MKLELVKPDMSERVVSQREYWSVKKGELGGWRIKLILQE
jgi:hypothetical protein